MKSVKKVENQRQPNDKEKDLQNKRVTKKEYTAQVKKVEKGSSIKIEKLQSRQKKLLAAINSIANVNKLREIREQIEKGKIFVD